MALTAAQEEEARRLYVRSLLTPAEKRIETKLAKARAKADAAQLEFNTLQKQCPHPLVSRTATNRGDSGNWCRGDDSYWTNHVCGLCGMYWTTGQRWKYVGGKHGHPDDQEAKES